MKLSDSRVQLLKPMDAGCGGSARYHVKARFSLVLTWIPTELSCKVSVNLIGSAEAMMGGGYGEDRIQVLSLLTTPFRIVGVLDYSAVYAMVPMAGKVLLKRVLSREKVKSVVAGWKQTRVRG